MKTRRTRWRTVVSTTTLVSMLAIILGSAAYEYHDRSQYEHDLSQAHDVVRMAVKQPTPGVQPVVGEGVDRNLLRHINFPSLWKVNRDAQRWLYVPGTKLDAPVLNEPRVGSYFYNLRGFNKRFNHSGSFLVPKAPAGSDGKPVDDGHLFILGHRMNDFHGEWQFSNLPTRWATRAGADAHPYVYVYYPDRAERWRVWMALDAWANDMIYDIPTPIGSARYERMLQHAQTLARYATNAVGADKNTHTLFLSTCNVVGRMLKRFVLVLVPDVTYTYATRTYVDMHDQHELNAWKSRLASERGQQLAQLAARDDFTTTPEQSTMKGA